MQFVERVLCCALVLSIVHTSDRFVAVVSSGAQKKRRPLRTIISTSLLLAHE